ncbi:MAG: type IV pili methyl-accepting chemotaxis transducer N-terminal domain-containing protein [Pseudomonadota bacterium]
MTTRRHFLAMLSSTAAAGLATPAFASLSPAIDATADATRRINIAGRQRMLTQRMAKAVGFARLGIETEMHLDQARDAHALFERSLRGLRYGDPELGLMSEKNSKVRDGLGVVSSLWFDYGSAVANSVAKRRVDDTDFETIVSQNLTILKEMNRTVGYIERAYGGSEIPLHLAVAINIAGRQRMFTQKMSKEVSMIAAGHAPDETRAALAETVTLFDNSLDALRNGMPMVGIQKPKTQEVNDQLARVAELWSALKPEVDGIATGGALTDATLVKVAEANNPLLVEMNKAVYLYENES